MEFCSVFDVYFFILFSISFSFSISSSSIIEFIFNRIFIFCFIEFVISFIFWFWDILNICFKSSVMLLFKLLKLFSKFSRVLLIILLIFWNSILNFSSLILSLIACKNLLHFKKIVAEKNKDLDLNNSGQLDL